MATWVKIGNRLHSTRSVQAATEPDPAAAGDGLALERVAFITLVLRAPQGQTFDGTGEVVAFVWSDLLDRWVRAPRSDEDLIDLAGLGEGALPPLAVSSPVGRLAFVYKGVGVSGAGDLELDLLCTNERGEAI